MISLVKTAKFQVTECYFQKISISINWRKMVQFLNLSLQKFAVFRSLTFHHVLTLPFGNLIENFDGNLSSSSFDVVWPHSPQLSLPLTLHRIGNYIPNVPEVMSNFHGMVYHKNWIFGMKKKSWILYVQELANHFTQ